MLSEKRFSAIYDMLCQLCLSLVRYFHYSDLEILLLHNVIHDFIKNVLVRSNLRILASNPETS